MRLYEYGMCLVLQSNTVVQSANARMTLVLPGKERWISSCQFRVYFLGCLVFNKLLPSHTFYVFQLWVIRCCTLFILQEPRTLRGNGSEGQRQVGILSSRSVPSSHAIPCANKLFRSSLTDARNLLCDGQSTTWTSSADFNSR